MQLMRFLRAFHNNEAGNVVMIFGLCLVPVIAVAGFSVDFQQTVKRKAKVQLVLDSAVLAAARVKQTGAGDAAVKTAVQQYLNAQIADLSGLECQPVSVFVSPMDEAIDATVRCAQATSLMRVVGQEQVSFKVVSGAEYGIDKIDIAFMFDISGSMNSASRLTNLKIAAKDAVNILLPQDAPPALIENSRLAMVSYNGMINAGQYFEDVAGVPARRTYYHTIPAQYPADDLDEGELASEFHIGLYDTDTGDLIAEFGDGAVIAVEDWQDDDLTVAITMDRSHSLYGQVQSMRLQLTGADSADQTENVEPYTLYGDNGIRNMNGQEFDLGEYQLRLRAYSRDGLSGTELFDEQIDFTLVLAAETEEQVKKYTLTSTCVWERDGPDKFTDKKPETGGYLEHRQAWYVEDENRNDGGYWEVGHPNRPNDHQYDGDECRNAKPLELTNNRAHLNSYIDSLSAGGWTAGHLGIAWTWYLISEEWNEIFDGSAAPLAYTEPDSAKVVVLMTDGAFNTEIFPEQGSSDEQARDVCDNIKSKGVKIYSVALNAPDPGKDVLAYCASGPSYFFEPETGAELTDAYRQIAVSISDLRLSR